MSKTAIEWADYTWNPITGCTPVSEGCQNCYAKRMAQRLAGRCGYPADEPFRVTLHPERLEEPLRLRKPRRIFVCSMSDLFHPDVPDEFIDKVFAVMALCYLKSLQHTFLVLTKRPERMRDYIQAPHTNHVVLQHFKPDREGGTWPLPNVWLGVTAENQRMADERIPFLLQTPAAVRFVSCEPLLGPVDLETQLGGADESRRHVNGWHGIDWVIVGGETGPSARPIYPDWVRSLRDQCQAAGVPFFFKQWGEFCYPSQMPDDTWQLVDAHVNLGCHPDVPIRVGKQTAGRLLDGQIWDQYPIRE